MLSALYHEGQANEKAAQQRREAKYGGEQETDTVVDLSEPMIPGILVKKIVRVGNGEIPPVGSVVSGKRAALTKTLPRSTLILCSLVLQVGSSINAILLAASTSQEVQYGIGGGTTLLEVLKSKVLFCFCIPVFLLSGVHRQRPLELNTTYIR